MFTGIITHTVEIKQSQREPNGLSLTFARPTEWTDMQLGESIATNGVCLTVSGLRPNEYDCFLMPETLAKTVFGKNIPASVNLERSLRAGDRFGGHFVQGHVDGIGTVTKIGREDGYRVFVSFDAQFEKLVINKGSIAIDGVSLTIASLKDNELSVALIPHTLEHTTLGVLKAGDLVNLEFDMLGKYLLGKTNND